MRHLKKETEMRCEISETSSLAIKLINGTAEIFGVELAPNKEYTFRDRNIALFTWYGCTIELSGDESGTYAFNIDYYVGNDNIILSSISIIII